MPVYYKSNPAHLSGNGDAIAIPSYADVLDFEFELAAVIGHGGRDIPASDAAGHIYGFMIYNDFSAREIQAREMSVGLGPAKGKDFATSLGPVVVTPDEFDGREGEMVARVNGEERSRGNLRDLNWPWERLLEQAARNTHLVPGDVIGSGTVGTGCILELGDGRWLRPGDEVELEVEGLGVLRNRIAPPIEG